MKSVCLKALKLRRIVDRKQIHIYNKSFGEFYRYTRFANKSGVDEHVAKLKNSVNEV